MRTFLVCAALAAAMQPSYASAQFLRLTEAEFLVQLTEQSPRVQAARAAVDIVRAEALAASRWPNPRVTFNREAVAGVGENMVTVAQSLPLSSRRQLEISAASARADASASRAEDLIRRLRADARRAFTDLWAAQEREQELARGRDRLNELAAILGTREAAGEAAGFDKLRADGEVLDVDASRAMATTERLQAAAILTSFLVARREGPAIEAVRPVPANADLPTVDELMARAETSRGDLTAFARDVDAAQFAERAAARRAVPDPEIVAGTKTSNAAGGDVGSIVGVHVALPLFGRGAPERVAAGARGRQARAELESLRQMIRAQIAAWRAAVVERRAFAERHRTALSGGVAQVERIAQVSYEAGERGILELLDAYRTSSAARLRQVELDAAVREGEIELEFASGWDIP